MADGMTADGSTIGRFGSGREVKRIEDAGLLAGNGRFTDDFTLPGQTTLAFLRSPHAHADIVSIDTTTAAAMPGVLAILTGADLAAAGVQPLPVAPIFVRPDGSPGATPLRTGQLRPRHRTSDTASVQPDAIRRA